MKLIECLRNAVKKSYETGAPEPHVFSHVFMNQWMYEHEMNSGIEIPDNGYVYFLFCKNASVTNMQFVELNSLIRTFANVNGKSGRQSILFFTSQFYKNYLENLFVNIATAKSIDVRLEYENSKIIESVVNKFRKYHKDVLINTIIVDTYYTSASVAIPPSIKLDLKSIVHKSGYIHSVGSLVYESDINKTEQIRIVDSIKASVDPVDKVYIVPYADEYFSPYDSGVLSIRNGLDSVRLLARKHHFENVSLDEFMKTISSGIPNARVPLGKSPYGDERRAAVSDGCIRDVTIWILTDRDLVFSDTDNYASAGKQHFIFIYKQYIYNSNPLLTFKERKPGWIQNVTLPHTLSRSLFATAAKNLSGLKSIRILDPFVGSGTTLFDACTVWPECKFVGLDADYFSKIIASDNAKFFSLGPSELAEIASRLEFIVSIIESSSKLQSEKMNMSYFKKITKNEPLIVEFVQYFIGSGVDVKEEPPPTNVDKIMKLSFSDRIIYYLTWRALKNGKYLISKNGWQSICYTVLKEFRRASNEIRHLERDRSESSLEECDGYKLIYGQFSASISDVTDKFSRISSDITSGERIIIKRVDDSISEMEGMPDDEFDLIVTDPPYGFNTSEENHHDMPDLYRSLIIQCVRLLANDGELILCLPANARTGKTVPFYQTRHSVISQIIIAAASLNKTIVWQVDSQILGKTLIDPPYYWGGSASSISRDVLHFKFQRIGETS